MTKPKKALIVAVAALFLALGVTDRGLAYDDVIQGLDSIGMKQTPEFWFSWSAVFHQDTFVQTNLLEDGGGPAYQNGTGGHVTVGRPGTHPDPDNTEATDRIITYGAGNVWEVNIKSGSALRRRLLPVDSTLKIVMGNMATKNIELISPGDTASPGTATAVDSLTGTTLTVPAQRFTDSNNDGIIMYKTYLDFGVVEGSDLYYDYNRDGEIHDVRLDTAVTDHEKSDRPFVAIYENTTGPRIDMTNPPLVDHDADGQKTDNLWVGNPYSPVDADYVGGPRGDDAEAPAGTPEADPNVTDITGFDEALAIGELKGVYMLTVVNLFEHCKSNLFMVSSGCLDVEITDGRLYDWWAARQYDPDNQLFRGSLNASMLFELGHGATNRYEFLDDGTLVLEGQAVPEPSAALLFLAPLAAVIRMRRRRK
jgi:hypothetical protein